jgi:hypothetical protein
MSPKRILIYMESTTNMVDMTEICRWVLCIGLAAITLTPRYIHPQNREPEHMNHGKELYFTRI